MEDEALIVFAAKGEAFPLRRVANALRRSGFPAALGVGTAGEAAPDDLEALDWDAAFVRWNEPEPHEVALLERATLDEDEAAEALTAATLARIAAHPDNAGRLIVTEHLRRTQTVYSVSVLPALVADEDHAAWSALDTVLTALAQSGDGLIYAAAEGFYDETGELLLAEEPDDADTEDEE